MNRGSRKDESRQVAAGEQLSLAGPTGLEPATSGVKAGGLTGGTTVALGKTTSEAMHQVC
jgi:hypothetical protein